MFAIDNHFEFSDDDSDMLERIGPQDGPNLVRCYRCGNTAYLVEHRGKTRLSAWPTRYVPHVHAGEEKKDPGATNDLI